ncbi:MAG: response regulator [Candidatus Anammoxibacter sp.]
MAKQILIIDDEEIVAESLRFGLGKKGYDVTIALTGEEGIEKVKKNQPDIVFIDLRLPGIDGIEVLRTLHESYPNMRYYLITAFSSDFNEKIQLAAKAGINFDLCKKPITPDQMQKIIESNINDQKHVCCKLFVTPGSDSAKKAHKNLLEIFDKQNDINYELEIVDINKETGLAEQYNIIATPTLVAGCGGKELQIIGDMHGAGNFLKEVVG